MSEGQFGSAVDAFTEGLNQATRNKNKPIQLQCLMNLGLLAWNMDNIEESSGFYAQSLEMAQELMLSKHVEFCESAQNIHQLYLQGRQYFYSNPAEPNASLREAIDLAREIESPAHELKCLSLMSRNYFNSGTQESLNLGRRALAIAQRLNHKTETMRLLNYLGSVYAQNNNPAQALTHFFEALTIAKELELQDKILLYSPNLANIYLKFGDFEKSFEYQSAALTAAREIKSDLRTASILNSLGVHLEQKAKISKNDVDLQKALDYFKEALHLFEMGGKEGFEIMTLNNIGHIYTELGQYSEALVCLNLGLEMAKESAEEQTYGNLLTNIGDLQLELNRYADAKQAYLQAQKIGERIESVSILQRTHFGLGRIAELQHKYDLALVHYREAIDEIEQVSSTFALDVAQSGYVHSKLYIYERLLNVYFTLYSKDRADAYGAEMFLAAEKGKARSFLDNLAEFQIDIGEKLSDEYRKRESEITDRILDSIDKMSEGDGFSNSDLDLIENELIQAEDEYTNLLNQMLLEKVNIPSIISPRPFSLKYLQERLLDPQTVLIEYALGSEKSFAFFVSNKNFKVFDLPSEGDIKDSIKGYLKVLTDPSQEKYLLQKASRRLYRELFSPLAEVIPEDVSNLIIIPDGILYYLPFETLIPSSERDADGQGYLISKYAFSYMPSASSLVFINERKTGQAYNKDLLVFGAPDYSRQSSSEQGHQKNPMSLLYEIYEDQGYEFLPLPYTRKEINKISEHFPKKRTDIYLDKEANEETIKQLPLNDYKMIHFACHSFLDEAFPLRSALVLSLDENFKEDGFLKVREIYNLNLDAELVVLSACRTGKGKLEGSDGVLGLPRIFFYAGAKSVVSTLWGINDKSTADLMHYFYQFLSEGENKAHALQLAKIKMIQSRKSHPYFWGAFVLSGNSRSTITPN